MNEIMYIKGIGPKRAEKLNKLNIFTLKQMLYYFPRQYEDRSNKKSIINLVDEEKALVIGKICYVEENEAKNKMTVIKFTIKDNTGFLKLTYFNQKYLTKAFKVDDYVCVFGKVKKDSQKVEMLSPEIEKFDQDKFGQKKEIITPIYSLTYGLTNKELCNYFSNVFEKNNVEIEEYLPEYIIKKYNLCDINYAIKNIHNPTSKEALKVSLYRIVFEEFFVLQLGLFLFKGGNKEVCGIKFEESKHLKNIKESLPFKLTNAQNNALDDILSDMKSNKPMNRLVQGDVGSGKTVVALLSLCNAVLNNYQGVFMAPTEILARQHFESFSEILGKFNFRIELLVGSLTKKKKNEILEKLKNNEIDILIGTHALIEDNVCFSNLGLVITDEQHRFGVRQRNKLSQKGISPDVLVMTATPIPRTLALILYGDLDISIIDELPPGRKEIKTIAVDKTKRDFIYNSLVKDEVKKGRQVYIVCPLVEESEELNLKSATTLVEELKEKYFNDLNVGLLHGKMKAKEKDFVMENFKKKQIDILVSTTVIEVGVNVPNATVMIVENSERFGLSQLHQLRGRVGRGSFESFCVLIYESKSEVCKERMKIMEQTNDGFKISEKDLELRGPGEFFGTKQHGVPELKIANIFKHMKVLKLAQQEARYLIGNDSNLNHYQNQKLKEHIFEKFSEVLKEISLN